MKLNRRDAKTSALLEAVANMPLPSGVVTPPQALDDALKSFTLRLPDANGKPGKVSVRLDERDRGNLIEHLKRCGFAIVPTTPTQRMVCAALDAYDQGKRSYSDIFGAMIRSAEGT